jgi:hypothetical protein
VFARFGKFCVIVALVLTTGAHWAVLQTVAWTTMLAGNLRTHPVCEAVTCTFDGQHPCCLCKAIAAGKKSEKKTEFTLQAQKLEFPPSPENFTLVAPSYFQLLPQTNIFAVSLTFRPPTPPPRNLFV